MINVTRSSMPSFEEYCEEIRDLWDSRWLTNMGQKHQALEQALGEYLGCRYLALHTNGICFGVVLSMVIILAVMPVMYWQIFRTSKS